MTGTAAMSAVDILARLKGVRRSGRGWTAKCPAHEDQQNSLSIHHPDGKWLLKCHAGCDWKAVIAAIGVTPGELFDGCNEQSASHPQNNRATAQPPGLTLEQYPAAKALPVDFLRACGLSDITLVGRPAVRIPYLSPDGEELPLRFRVALNGDRFRWKSGNKPCLYGLNRTGDARTAGYVVM